MSAIETVVEPVAVAAAAERAVQRVLIVGAGALARCLEAEIAARPRSRYRVVGQLPELAREGGIRQALRSRPDCVVVAADGDHVSAEPLLACRLRGIAVEDGVSFYERLTGKCAIEFMRMETLIYCRELWSWRLDATLSRGLSVVLAACGLLLLAPLFALIALAIKLTSQGPVFFRQSRVGVGGRPFDLFKFRTMRPVKNEPSHWAADNADRITPVGAVLRKFRLDELPQFWNVLRGEMNLIGPRPHPVANYKLFLQRIPHYALRERVRPGITGWAQVRYGYANNLEEETEKMRYDLYYIKHLSLALDLQILLYTFKIVLFGHEACPLEPRHTDPIDERDRLMAAGGRR